MKGWMRWMAARGLAAGVTGCMAMAAGEGSSLPLARDGQALVKIVIDPRNASPEEQRAATNLCAYLSRVTGAPFDVADERDIEPGTPAVYVGLTSFADSQGIHATRLGPQETRLRTLAGSLILCGGRPYGTTFGVWRLLEEFAGCRWYTVHDEVVPERRDLALPALDKTWIPAFRFRTMYRQGGEQTGAYGKEAEWLLRNRMAAETVGRPEGANTCHTFAQYFNPKEYAEEHPEWASFYGGQYHREVHDQFCLTADGPRRIVLEKLKRDMAEQRGVDYYEVSQNDGNQQRCQCRHCLAIEEREGKTGPFLDFVNYLADGVTNEFPDAVIRTFAYNVTGRAPSSMRARPNVCVRKCLNSFMVHRRLDEPVNRWTIEELNGWRQAASRLYIWEYDDRPGGMTGWPIPAFESYESRYQTYVRYNVEGVFSESELLVMPRQFVEMKQWAQVKLMEDPSRGVWPLVDDFARAIYGAAAPPVVAYVKLLETRRAQWPWKLFDVPFFNEAAGLFDAAEAAVKDDPAALARVREARFPNDLTWLLFWTKARTDWKRGGGDMNACHWDRGAVIARVEPYLDSLLAEKRWLRPSESLLGRGVAVNAWQEPFQKALVEPIVREAAAARDTTELPPELAGIAADRLFEYPVPLFRYGMPGLGPNIHGGWKREVEWQPQPDPQAASGLGLFISDERMKNAGGVLPFAMGVYDFSGRTGGGGRVNAEDVKAPGYQLYRMVRTKLTDTCYLYFTGSWLYQIRHLDCLLDPAAPEAKWDIYVSVRFDGPDMPFGDPARPRGVWLDRVFLVREEIPE